MNMPDPTMPERPYTKTLSRVSGMAAVSALFAKGADRIERLFFNDAMKKEAGTFASFMAKAKKPYRLVPDDELEKVSGTVMHGGIVAIAKPQIIEPLDTNLALSWAASGETVLFLDGVSNPQNIGAIARTVAFFGLTKLVFTDHPSQAGLSDASYRIAEGGLEYLALYRALNPATLLKSLKAHYRVLGAAPGQHVKLAALPLDKRPTLLVLGNEEEGLPVETMKACEAIVSIAGGGKIQSLNVSASTAIFLYALTQE